MIRLSTHTFTESSGALFDPEWVAALSVTPDTLEGKIIFRQAPDLEPFDIAIRYETGYGYLPPSYKILGVHIQSEDQELKAGKTYSFLAQSIWEKTKDV